MRKRFSLSLLLCLAAGACSEPLYESDPALYHQYRYWQTAEKNWIKAGDFDFFVETSSEGPLRFMKMTPHRKGVPDFTGSYQREAKLLAFKTMEHSCGADGYDLIKAVLPNDGRLLDPYFYQNADLSVGVTFACRTKETSAPLSPIETEENEARKWSSSTRERRVFEGSETYIDTLPATATGMYMFKIRMFDAPFEKNKRLAGELMKKTCGEKSVSVAFIRPSAEYTKRKPFRKIDTANNVYAYAFHCR